ncbi:MAG TPA: MFS transporter [Pirellulales bacterium]|nr:MFS transporter [Pirellulales bacterium]
MEEPELNQPRWYAEVTAYQWLVLAIASAGWIFDVFEGQVFNITRGEMLKELLESSDTSGGVKFWGDIFLAVFLIGGTLGGVLFGSLADRFGRKPTMAVTILCYSIFSGLTYFATELWHVAALRFLVAMGVGGEWAVAAALVAEVFPARARAHAAGIFHASSVLGTWIATLAGLWVGAQWRYAYLVGVVPALLVLWVRSSVEEPESWRQAEREQRRMGSFGELFGDRRWARSAILGMILAAVGLGTFWGVTVAGQNLAEEMLLREAAGEAAQIANAADEGISNSPERFEPSVEAKKEAGEKAKFAYGIVETAGGGLGLLAFGPLAARLGRKPTFALMQLGALAIVPITCYVPQTYTQMLCLLPVFGFFTLGMHAGYAIYFPELFPGHLRATGTGVCFNGGRLLAASMLWISAEVKALPGMDLRLAVCLLSSLFLVGLAVICFLPETKGRPLPE